jgi:hypothetical protein
MADVEVEEAVKGIVFRVRRYGRSELSRMESIDELLARH